MTRVGPSILLLLLMAPAGLAQPEPENMALHKSYTLEPPPTYGPCADAADRTQLTDGEYTQGHFWVDVTTVGWVHTRPVAITIDLGQVEPISGLLYSTAAGRAGVTWPTSIQIMVSDDGDQWIVLGDLVAMSNQRGAPAPEPYSTHRYVTRDLQARGRYIALVVEDSPYTFVDEIEVYRGPRALLDLAPQGERVAESPLEYQRNMQLAELVRWRMRADLAEVSEGIDQAELSEAEKAKLRVRVESLSAEIDAQGVLPEGSTTILPLNDLHARIYALQAPLLRARGYEGLTAWGGYRYDMLRPMQAPAKPPRKPPTLSARMMRNEHRAEVFNLTNATDGPLTATVHANGLAHPGCLALREVLFTDTRERTPVAAALLPAERSLRVTVPAGTTRQVWLDFNSRDVPAGNWKASVKVSSGLGKGEVTLPLKLHVAKPIMPSEFSVAIGGWDETNGTGGYDVTPENMAALIANLRDHGVNMPWSNPRVVPSGGQYDAEGNLTAPLDFGPWDEWVDRWRGAQHYGVFAAVGNTFEDEALGSERFLAMVGAWVTAWMRHIETQGIEPSQIKLLLVDEPRSDEHDNTTIGWATAVHAAQPELVIWTDPHHADPAEVDPRFYAASDVLSPNMMRFLKGGKPHQDFFVAQQQAGRELWFYSCSGPAKLLDPASYWRGQFWLNIKYGGK
ncbi:MAG: discoidin domain-containing protein, partial [Candidatus Brocadiia bacterium]|nr:discoidin domain-containing protein [Candidatus Brocadiia bacterium]